MSSAALPYLVRELRVRDPALKLMLMETLGKQSVIGIKFTPAYVRHCQAIQACRALGPAAKAVIPELAELLNERQISPLLRTWSLGETGPDALPVMISALTNGDPQIRIYTAESFRHVWFEAEAAVPALITCLSDPQDHRVRCSAALALAHIGRRADVVLPALTRNLSDANGEVRRLTSLALARFPVPSPETNR